MEGRAREINENLSLLSYCSSSKKIGLEGPRTKIFKRVGGEGRKKNTETKF